MASRLTYYPYRCNRCSHRFLRRQSETPAQSVGEDRPVGREIHPSVQSRERRRMRRDVLIYVAAALVFLGFLYFITHEHATAEDGCARPPVAHQKLC